jgi:hypothetical protein
MKNLNETRLEVFMALKIQVAVIWVGVVGW